MKRVRRKPAIEGNGHFPKFIGTRKARFVSSSIKRSLMTEKFTEANAINVARDDRLTSISSLSKNKNSNVMPIVKSVAGTGIKFLPIVFAKIEGNSPERATLKSILDVTSNVMSAVFPVENKAMTERIRLAVADLFFKTSARGNELLASVSLSMSLITEKLINRYSPVVKARL